MDTEDWWNDTDGAEVLKETPVPVLFCLPQISHGLTLYRTRTSSVADQRLTA